MPYAYTELGPVVFANVTTAQRLLLNQRHGFNFRRNRFSENQFKRNRNCLYFELQQYGWRR